MRRIIAILAVLALLAGGAITSDAKTTKRTSKTKTTKTSRTPHWEGKYSVDDYTEKRTPKVEYLDMSEMFICSYDGEQLLVFVLHDTTDNFDLWWDAGMNNNGNFDYDTDICCNFVGNRAIEICDEATVYHFRNNTPDLHLGLYFVSDELDYALRNNTRVNIKFYDKVEGRYRVLKVPLAGFSKACQSVRLQPQK